MLNSLDCKCVQHDGVAAVMTGWPTSRDMRKIQHRPKSLQTSFTAFTKSSIPSFVVANPKLNLTAASFSAALICKESKTGLALLWEEHALPVEMQNPFWLRARSVTCPGIPGKDA